MGGGTGGSKIWIMSVDKQQISEYRHSGPVTDLDNRFAGFSSGRNIQDPTRVVKVNPHGTQDIQ